MEANLENSKFDMFPLLNLCAQDNIEANKNPFIKYLNALLIHFKNYFGNLNFYKIYVDEFIYRRRKWRGWIKQ